MALSAKVGASSRIFLRGAPAEVTAASAKDFFSKYGAVEDLFIVEGKGCGYVEFQSTASAQKVVAEAAKLEIQGKKIEVKMAVPPLSGGIDAGLPNLAMVEPAESPQALDVVVIRGHATTTGIGLAAMYAKAKTTVLVLWDQQHRPAQEEAMAGALSKRVYNTMEEEMADAGVMGKAFEYFGVGAPKCALVHVTSDKIVQESSLGEQPLWEIDSVCAGIKENHTETLQCFYALGIYQPWVHAFRACAFIVIPSMLGWDWPEDLCICTVGSRRVVKADPLRSLDGCGWTIGLQTTTDSAPVNASLAFGAINTCVLADEGQKHQYSGKTLNLTMPKADVWCKQ